MQLKRFLFAGAFALAAFAASPAAKAQQCAGFVDVLASNPFCANIEWIKNRGVTTGCTRVPGGYCPDDPVDRTQMAAFMNRLGTALTPIFLRKRQTALELGALNFTAAQTVCRTDPVAPSLVGLDINGFPRTAIITGLLNVFTPDDAFELQAQIVFSTNNGASWQPVPAGDGFAFGSLYETVPGTSNLFSPPFDISLRAYTFMDLNVGSSYRFAVQGTRTLGPGAVANTYCELHVQVISRTGSSPQLDEEQPDPRPPGRGM